MLLHLVVVNILLKINKLHNILVLIGTSDGHK